MKRFSGPKVDLDVADEDGDIGLLGQFLDADGGGARAKSFRGRHAEGEVHLRAGKAFLLSPAVSS